MISLMKQLFMKISYIPMLMLLKKEIAIEAVAVGRNLHKILLINLVIKTKRVRHEFYLVFYIYILINF